MGDHRGGDLEPPGRRGHRGLSTRGSAWQGPAPTAAEGFGGVRAGPAGCEVHLSRVARVAPRLARGAGSRCRASPARGARPRRPRPGGAHCTLCRSAPTRRVLLPSGGAHRVGPGWAGPGAIGAGEVALGGGAMEARPVPDFSKLQELLAPPCLDPKASRAPPLQQAPRTPGCPRPNGRCVKERPLPQTWPSGQRVRTAGSWGYPGVTVLVTGA